MNTIKNLAFVALITLTTISCKKEITTETATTDTKEEATNSNKTIAANPKTASFEIEGMTCAIGCASLIEGKLNKLDGVTEAKVDFETKTATVVYDADKLNQEKLTQTVEAAAGGDTYKVSKIKS